MKKQLLSTIMLFALLACVSGAVWAQNDVILLDQLGSQHENVRNQAMQVFLERGPESIPVLIAQIGGENRYLDKFAKRAVETLVNQTLRPGGHTGQIAVESQLIHVVLNDSTAVQLNFALLMLSRVGSDTAVPAIATHLQGGDTWEMARYALERIPGPKAGEALLNALPGTVCPKGQAALIKTLGAKKYRPAYRAILKEIKNPDRGIRLAAIAALGRVAEPQALKPLLTIFHEGYGRIYTAAAEALLQMAEGMIEQGELVRARKIYTVLWDCNNPVQLRCAALRGFVNLDGKQAWTKLMIAINHSDPQIRGMAKELFLEMSSSDITLQLVKALAHASGPARLDLINILALKKDPAAGSAAPLLIQCLKADCEVLRGAAANALIQIPGDDVSNRVLYAIDIPDGGPDEELVRILGEREYYGAIMRLRELASGDSPIDNDPVEKAAQKALAKLSGK